MERALVIFESMFGNTRTIAEAVADGLSSRFMAELTEVSVAPTRIAEDVSLVVVGGPTHAFGLTRARTRADAVNQTEGPLVSPADGLREWLETVEPPASGLDAAAFDTRIDKPRVPGSAARAAAKRLRRLGFRVVTAAESFFVKGTTGPLVPGEVERARDWAEQVAERSTPSSRWLTSVVYSTEPGSWCAVRDRRRPRRDVPPRASRGSTRRSSSRSSRQAAARRRSPYSSCRRRSA